MESFIAYLLRFCLCHIISIQGNEMQQFFGNISKWREELESQGVDSGTTTDAVALITYVQTLKKQTKVGQETVSIRYPAKFLHYWILCGCFSISLSRSTNSVPLNVCCRSNAISSQLSGCTLRMSRENGQRWPRFCFEKTRRSSRRCGSDSNISAVFLPLPSTSSHPCVFAGE